MANRGSFGSYGDNSYGSYQTGAGGESLSNPLMRITEHQRRIQLLGWGGGGGGGGVGATPQAMEKINSFLSTGWGKKEPVGRSRGIFF